MKHRNRRAQKPAKSPHPKKLGKIRLRYALTALLSVVVLVAVIVSVYIYRLLDQPVQTEVPIVTSGAEVSEGILDHLPDIDEMETSETSSNTASASAGPSYNAPTWGNGRVKVYVNSGFPITMVPQKDSNVENILLIGVDARGAYETQSRTDSIIVVTIDRNNNSVKLTSFMRDTQVKIPGRTEKTKINAAYVYGGIGLLINTMNINFDLDIQKFAMVDMYSAENIINVAGGVTINVTSSEVSQINMNLAETNSMFSSFSDYSPSLTSSGNLLLNGRQAVAYGRIRYIGTDTGRTQRQRTVLSALIVSFKASSVSRKLGIFEAGLQAFETNMTKSDMFFLSFDVLSGMRNIQQYRVPQDGMYVTNTSNYQLVVDFAKQIPALHQFIWGNSSSGTISMPENGSESEGSSESASSDSSDSSSGSSGDSDSSSSEESSDGSGSDSTSSNSVSGTVSVSSGSSSGS